MSHRDRRALFVDRQAPVPEPPPVKPEPPLRMNPWLEALIGSPGSAEFQNQLNISEKLNRLK